MDSDLFTVGTKSVLDSLEQAISSKEYPIDTVILNLGTIARNCLANEAVKEAIEFDKRRGVETDKPAYVLFEEAKKEMINTIQYIAQMLNNAGLIHNPAIITYHANYGKCISQELYRQPPPSKRIITLANELIRTKLITGKRKTSTIGKVTLIEIPMNDKFCPWRYFIEELKHLKNEHCVAMISSHPADYHIGQMCRSFRVFRSYTGEVIWYRNLGAKLFDNENIPFNIYTHAILGDKEDVQSSLKGTSKQKLFQIAEDEEWSLKTKDYIRERLYQLNIRIPTQF